MLFLNKVNEADVTHILWQQMSPRSIQILRGRQERRASPKEPGREKCGVPDGDRARDRWVQKTGKPPEEASLVVERAQLWSDLRGRLAGEGPGRTMKGKIKCAVPASLEVGRKGFLGQLGYHSKGERLQGG